MVEMYYKKDGCKVTVSSFFENGTALIFSPSLAGKSNGAGFIKVKVNQLVPVDYFEEHSKTFISKTERNKIKSRLTLVSALWECSDKMQYKSCDEAVEHERELIEKEKREKDA
jgi:hypothetical protein